MTELFPAPENKLSNLRGQDRHLQPTPFHLRTANLNKKNLWTNWGRYTCPLFYENLEVDYFALRNRAALIDFSPLFKYQLYGPDAEAYLRKLISSADLPPSSQAQHVVLDDNDGFAIADVVLHHLWKSEYRLTSEVPIFAWLADSAAGHNIVLSEVSEVWGILTVGGPAACAVMLSAGFTGLENLRLGNIRNFDIAGFPVTVVRSGALGDLAYELWVAPENALGLWDRLMRTGTIFGLGVSGVAATDVFRLERGVPRAGRDYVSREGSGCDGRLPMPALALIGTERTRLRDPKKKNETSPVFINLWVREPGPRELVSFEIDARQTGIITTQAYSPGLDAVIALALWHSRKTIPDRIVATSLKRESSDPKIEYVEAIVKTAPLVDLPQRLRTPPHAN
jgi:aminomethyltransferase